MELEVLVGNLTDQNVEAIVNPANSEGEMGGGVAAAIKSAGGAEIELEAMEKAPIPIGKAVVTSPGKLRCQSIIHAPTMRMPVQRTNVKNITLAMNAVFTLVRDYEIASMAIPGFGTGTGGVSVADSAKAMIDAIRKHNGGKTPLEKLILVDQNLEMVKAWDMYWRQEDEDADD